MHLVVHAELFDGKSLRIFARLALRSSPYALGPVARAPTGSGRHGRPQTQGEHPVLAKFAVGELRVEEDSPITLRVLFIGAQRGPATCRRVP